VEVLVARNRSCADRFQATLLLLRRGGVDVPFKPVLMLSLSTAVLLAATPDTASALNGKALVKSQCTTCHNVVGPAPKTFEGVLNRKAPDLFYAGSKFNRPWLVKWIQNPSVIRQAGMMFLNKVVNEGGKDKIKDGSVKPCPAKLKSDEAEAVADYLMTLKDPKMKTGVIDPKKPFSRPRAVRMFTKQYPCIGCHTIKRGAKQMGGVSGPKLVGAGERLNPDWVYARIENPQYWDPKTWMPQIPLSHKKREMLTLFISSMK
jgi:mono/diheme cytochrome c family protein